MTDQERYYNNMADALGHGNFAAAQAYAIASIAAMHMRQARQLEVHHCGGPSEEDVRLAVAQLEREFASPAVQDILTR